MEAFDASWFLETARIQAELATRMNYEPGSAPALIGDREKKSLKYQLDQLRERTEACGLKTTVRSIERSLNKIQPATCTWQEYIERVRIVLETLENELSTIRLMRVEPNKTAYYDNVALFGEEVNHRFARASRDIRDAGTCYAAGCNTACVFHLMRVIEVALAETARIMDVAIDLEGESRSWQTIIDSIKKRSVQLESSQPKELDWKHKRQFAHAVLERVRSIKDAWRNPVMHVVEHHDEHSALSILNHTEAFMRDLVRRLDEINQATGPALPLDLAADEGSKGPTVGSVSESAKIEAQKKN